MATHDDVEYFRGTVRAPFGTLTVVVSDNGVRYCTFDNDAHPKSFEGMTVVDNSSHPILGAALQQLAEYLEGSRTTFNVPLDLRGTEFQVAAWKALADIPYGHTASYAQQALSIGRPRATRAIGAANGRNPVAVILPCHRIIGANGALTGFGGGLPVKKWLLEHEERVAASH